MKDLIKSLGFVPKENTSAVFIKTYSQHDGYNIEVDVENQIFHFGGRIKIGEKESQNITKKEDWVVLECINRLLERGYKPENITLEKVYPAGHGFSGRLDICVTRDDNSEYLLIECKTYGKEFEKEFARMKKDGGQLFTYFKFGNKADCIMLYASEFKRGAIISRSEIVKIEDKYRSGDVKDFYAKWDKISKETGVWDNEPYNLQVNKFTKKNLKPLSEEESKKIFHGFTSILRKHSVSDKPNAFNKIFNLFLAKLYDEAKRDDDELDFCWKNGDDPVDFQVRLINLHKNGLYEFLKKEIEGIVDSDFNASTIEELKEKKKKILKFNKIFDIKDVFDDTTFDENFRVLKEVVQLLEKYQIRYPRKQQHLSDFFEQLLTTGLKQEVGQYFTPPPITKFIVKSLPLATMIEQEVNNEVPKLPAVIDYAAGSGHFITEALEEYQDIINKLDTKGFYPKAIKAVDGWKANPYDWAATYVYGIEKDYRLVKVAKVGCYFYGDGVAQIIHGDGLDNFAISKTYVGLLKENTNLEDSTKAKFSVVVSNPPYAVNDCKDDLEYIQAQGDFSLYSSLTDKSDNIECLFVERTKHLLKDGGVAAVVLPSPLLQRTGIQTKTREIILRYFDIIAIAEFGSNTFMATGTNTVTLFLKRRNNKLNTEWKKSVEMFFENGQDMTIRGIEKIATKFINHVWGNITIADYISLIQRMPNEVITEHDFYRDYQKKIKAKTEKEFFDTLIQREKDKFLFFVIAFPQKVVLVKTGEKEAEKRFLGYYFSDRRGGEGIHPIQGGKTIDECTKLYGAVPNDATKASSYILDAFNGNLDRIIDESLQENISRVNLVDMLDFDRTGFEKTINLNVKKKIKIESKWKIVRIKDICEIGRGRVISKKEIESNPGQYPVYSSQTSNEGVFGYLKTNDFEGEYVTWTTDGIYAGTCFYRVGKFNCTNVCGTLKAKTDDVKMKFLSLILNNLTKPYVVRVANPKLMNNVMAEILIPLPALDIQQKIVDEAEEVEKREIETRQKIEKGNEKIKELFSEALSKAQNIFRLSDTNVFDISIGKRVLKSELKSDGHIPVYSANVFEPLGYTDHFLVKNFSTPSVLWGIDGDWMVNYIPVEKGFYPTDHCGILRVKDNQINERFLAYILKKEGQALGFSRQKRASIDRIQGIRIQVPSISEQQKVASEIEKIEMEIIVLESELVDIQAQKDTILGKYL